ncbi:hypothetical protein ACA910_013361 [Epithemia clementina (nom. ined.)]
MASSSRVVAHYSSTAPRAVASLYRSILRAHRQYLPMEMRVLGDSYVKTEFRLHTTQGPAKKADATTTGTTAATTATTTPEQLATFCREWEKYLNHIVTTGQELKAHSAHLSSSSSSMDATGDHGTRPDPAAIRFGEDLPEDVELTEEQQAQLEKLRSEAAKLREDESSSAN